MEFFFYIYVLIFNAKTISMKTLKSAVVLLLLFVLLGCSGKQLEIKVLYWNVQNGMWSDQGNNYDNFVEFVKSESPDICVWAEAESR